MSKGWLTIPEAAAILGCSPSKVARMARQGEIRHKRIGRAVRIDPSEVMPNGLPSPVNQTESPSLEPMLQQLDLAMQQLQLIRQMVEAAIEGGP